MLIEAATKDSLIPLSFKFVKLVSILSLLDINECNPSGLSSYYKHFSHICHDDANCSNTNGSYYCTCLVGYSGMGTFCEGE